MTPESLKSLHDWHLELKSVNEQLDKGPKQLAFRKRKIKEQEQVIEAHQARLKELKLAVDRKNLDLKTLEKKLEDLQVKLNQASSNVEFDTFKSQIAADNVAKSVLEDEILEAFDGVENFEAEAPALDQKLQELLKEADDFAKKWEAEQATLTKQSADVQTHMKELEKGFKAEVAEQYRRVVKQQGAEAMASVEDGTCSGCYMGVTAQENIRLKSGEILFCKHCGALLYQDA